ncbi:hypothetical protein GQ457_04G022410 [Hibiscus cannabinus]
MNPAAYPADFPTGPGEQRNHNKKRRQDEDPPDSGGLPPFETTASPAQPPSYKDTLLGDRQHEIPKDDVFLDEEDIDLNEDDVIRGMDNDVITIDFSERVHNLAVKSLDQTVVIKIIGRRIGYVTLRNKLHEVWKPDQAFKLMDIENDYFLVTFRSPVDYLHVLADGPWTVFGHYVSVEPWSEDFSTAQPYPSNIVAWIRLPGLPVTLYKRSLITELGECIGRVLKLDYQTETGRRGRFARMAIRVNLNKPLVSKIVVNGRTQLVEYESLPTICFHCGKYGHVTDNCPELIPKDSAGPEMPSASTSEPSTAMFGSWMVVERRQRRPQLKTSVGKTHSPGVVISESRFAPIIDDNANEAGTNDLSPSAPASSPLVFAETSNMKQPTFPKRRSLPKTIASKSNSRALKATNKTSPTAQHSATFNVRKPLQLTLADLPILHRTGHKAGSSNHPSSSKGTTCLDQNRHSSVSLPENSDPNIPLHVPSKLVSNSLVAPPKKPPDPNDIVSPTAHAQESTSVDAHNAEISFDARDMINNGLLDQEELIWRQKSRSEWITHGDRNTTYFHRRAINRRQKSRIRALKLNNGEWITDDSTLKLEAVHFFSHLFSMEHNVPASFNTRATFQGIPPSLHAGLDAVPTQQEIREALFDMAPLKSPGWDGLHAEFIGF